MKVGVHYKIECTKFPLKMIEKSYFEDDDEDDEDEDDEDDGLTSPCLG